MQGWRRHTTSIAIKAKTDLVRLERYARIAPQPNAPKKMNNLYVTDKLSVVGMRYGPTMLGWRTYRRSKKWAWNAKLKFVGKLTDLESFYRTNIMRMTTDLLFMVDVLTALPTSVVAAELIPGPWQCYPTPTQ